MRKLPRRYPSNSPSLAYVAFAVLGIGLVCAIGGLYAHRQNQETTRKRQIAELQSEIEALRERNTAFEEEIAARLLAPTLQLAIKDQGVPLRKVTPQQVIPAEAPIREPGPLAQNH